MDREKQVISYANNFEDVLLQRAFPGEEPGFYIDVGAYEPTFHSVTKLFYDRGWSGINIEPNPVPFAKLRAERLRDINLNIGLSNKDGFLKIYEAPEACWSVDLGLLKGWFGAKDNELAERSVPVARLATVCEQYVPSGRTIDILKIDVEGHEREVIEGGDWARWRPRIVLAEAYRTDTWEHLLLNSGYFFTLHDGVNRLYVREEDRALQPLLSIPVNPSDNFLIHGYLQCISDLEQRLTAYQELGPFAWGVARWVHRTSLRHPRASRFVKRIMRRAAG